MTHLFMEIPKISDAELQIPGTDCVINVTRSGKAVTLINLSLSEPETVFRVFNELFYLMSIPSLDKFFRNPQTGKLKEVMGFIVDNGPSESLSSFLMRGLVRAAWRADVNTSAPQKWASCQFPNPVMVEFKH